MRVNIDFKFWAPKIFLVLILVLLVFFGWRYYRIRGEFKEKVIESAALVEKIKGLEEEIQKLKTSSPEVIKIKIPEGEGNFSQAEQNLGEEVGDLKIKSIRIGDHQIFFRVVFDIKKLDGSDSDKIPRTKAIYLSGEKAIEVEISGMGGNLSENPAIGKEVKIGDEMVSSYIGRVISDRSSLKYRINLKKTSNYFLHFLTDPARIIIDVQK
jgi:hypothetical protein